jgi:mannosylglycerate hydrolase
MIATYRWPARCDGMASRTGEVAHAVHTTVELRAGERFVRVAVSVDNRSRDHRLRAHFPLPVPAGGSRAECAFGMVERGLTAEGGPTEAPLATYPAQRFVQAGGLTVVHDGVGEYELVDIDGDQAHGLALTVLRASGMLSQAPMATRPLPAGPLVRTEGSQLQRRVTAGYAIALGDTLGNAVDPYALADAALVPLRAVTTRAALADLPAIGSALSVAGAVVSSVVREGDGLVVRVFNPSEDETEVVLDGRAGWLVDLTGRPIEPFEGSFALRPWGIATLSLTETPA